MFNSDSTSNDDQRSLSESNPDHHHHHQEDFFSSTNHSNEIIDRIRDGKVPKPDDERKLFVGQLSSEINKEDLEKYFSQFGSIEDVTIKYDVPGGRARGFAFILFDQKESIEKVLNVSTHFINQCQIDPKQAHRRPPVTNPVKKVFIGQLPTDFVEQDLSDYFSQFGLIDTIELPMDRGKSVRRPFGFVSFSSEKTAEEVLRQQRHSINGTSIEVRPAKPRPHEQQQQQQQQFQMQQQQQYPYGDYLLSHHSNPMLSSLTTSTITPQSMINLHNNPNSYYTQTMNNNNYNGQIIDQWGQGTNNPTSYWSTANHDIRANTNHNSISQWSTGNNGGLTSMTGGNSNVYGPLGNSSSSSSLYQQTPQGSIYNPNGMTQQISFPPSNYSNHLQPSYNSSSQSTGNIYSTGYSSTSSNDLQPSSSSTSSWNQYPNAAHLPNGATTTTTTTTATTNNYDPNIFYAPSYYPNIYSHPYYPSTQQQGMNQSQGTLTVDQTISPNGLTTSSNGGQDKTYQHISR